MRFVAIILGIVTLVTHAYADEMKGRFFGEDQLFYDPPTNLCETTCDGDWSLFVERVQDKSYLSAQLLAGIKKSIQQIRENEDILQLNCPKPDPERKEILFAFEGFLSYSKLKEIIYRNLPLISIDEELFDFYCKHPALKNVLKKDCADLAALTKIKKLAFHSEPWLLDLILAPYLNQNEFKDLAWAYFPEWGAHSAASCALKHYLANPKIKIKVVGHSYGGYATLEFANILKRRKMPIYEVLAIDPVRRKITRNDTEMKKPSNVLRFKTFNQRQDNHSIPIPLIGGIWGGSVSGADNTLKIFPHGKVETSKLRKRVRTFGNDLYSFFNEENPISKNDPKKVDTEDDSHVEILKDAEVQEAFLEMLRR